MKRARPGPLRIPASYVAVLCNLALTAAAFGGIGGGPTVTITYPNGGETLTSGNPVVVTWTASDPSGYIAGADVLVSFDGGANYSPVALGVFPDSQATWFVPNRPTAQARVWVIAYDGFGNPGHDYCDAFFSVASGASGLVSTTLRDFDLPGTQPNDVLPPNSPDDCVFCHGYYNAAVEPGFNWQGSMMAHASIDPLFRAAFDLTNRYAPESGDLCLRCHMNAGWIAGRSNPTDGSQLLPQDLTGISCDLCHRMVDPFYQAGESPIEDVDILAALDDVPSAFGNAMYVVDPDNTRRRGPFSDALPPHPFLYSPFHRESNQCGTCHDVSNPAFTRNPDGSITLNALDQAPPGVGPHQMMSEQRTFSEWLYSAFNSPMGVYAPEFGGNREYVASCQDCHMRAVTGRGCASMNVPLRNDLPLHDFSGGNTWVLGLIDQVDPLVDPTAINAGVDRARYMLQHAAEMDVTRVGGDIRVRITNKTGHKLPTGYPDGRRMWINVTFFDATDQLVGQSGAYDPLTAVLAEDKQLKVYEAEAVVSPATAKLIGLPAYSHFRFAVSDLWLKDNRIPPLGFTNAAYSAVGAGVVGYSYPDGQNWDVTLYAIPVGAVRAEVKLYYQTTTKDYVEFLYAEGGPGSPGEYLWNLWNANDKCPPELMESAGILGVSTLPGDMNCDGQTNILDINAFVLAISDPVLYAATYPGCDVNNGDINADDQVNVLDINPFVALLSGG
ncbi:hypothetical protein RAS1_12850 [Phycisphaerae bacterium RAS1]|nr:hypothetical protein RAS1_12850 [Phycisphaerae bacterium RAS1]